MSGGGKLWYADHCCCGSTPACGCCQFELGDTLCYAFYVNLHNTDPIDPDDSGTYDSKDCAVYTFAGCLDDDTTALVPTFDWSSGDTNAPDNLRFLCDGGTPEWEAYISGSWTAMAWGGAYTTQNDCDGLINIGTREFDPELEMVTVNDTTHCVSC